MEDEAHPSDREQHAVSRTVRWLLVTASVLVFALSVGAAFVGGAWVPFAAAIGVSTALASVLMTVRPAQWMCVATTFAVGAVLVVAAQSAGTVVAGTVLLLMGVACGLAVSRGGPAPGAGFLTRLMTFANLPERVQASWRILDWLRK